MTNDWVLRTLFPFYMLLSLITSLDNTCIHHPLPPFRFLMCIAGMPERINGRGKLRWPPIEACPSEESVMYQRQQSASSTIHHLRVTLNITYRQVCLCIKGGSTPTTRHFKSDSKLRQCQLRANYTFAAHLYS